MYRDPTVNLQFRFDFVSEQRLHLLNSTNTVGVLSTMEYSVVELFYTSFTQILPNTVHPSKMSGGYEEQHILVISF